MTFDEIDEATGFADGDKFTTDAQVRAYFQRDELLTCLDSHHTRESDIPDQAALDAMADTVIENHWHMA